MPLIYPDPKIVEQVLADYETADIPELHKMCARWTEKFVHESWTATAADIQALRDAGFPDTELVNWAESATVQTWWVMSADAGGVPIDDFLPQEQLVVRRDHHVYKAGTWSRAPSTEIPNEMQPANGQEIAWIDTNEDDPAYLKAADWANDRYGMVPNFLKAFSLRPALFPRHCRAFELLERPQSSLLTPRLHALVRALVSLLNHSRYFAASIEELLARAGCDPTVLEQLAVYPAGEFSEAERAVLDFASKMVRTSYKVTEQDSAALRAVGLDDAAYVDVLNTVSIQTTIERVANMFGVVPDSEPLLQRLS